MARMARITELHASRPARRVHWSRLADCGDLCSAGDNGSGALGPSPAATEMPSAPRTPVTQWLRWEGGRPGGPSPGGARPCESHPLLPALPASSAASRLLRPLPPPGQRDRWWPLRMAEVAPPAAAAASYRREGLPAPPRRSAPPPPPPDAPRMPPPSAHLTTTGTADTSSQYTPSPHLRRSPSVRTIITASHHSAVTI